MDGFKCIPNTQGKLNEKHASNKNEMINHQFEWNLNECQVTKVGGIQRMIGFDLKYKSSEQVS